jgi:hypothetical protein
VKVLRTAEQGGGTILAADNVTGPWEYHPRARTSSVAGAAEGGTVAYIASDGYLSFVVTGSTGSTAGTVHLFYRG